MKRKETSTEIFRKILAGDLSNEQYQELVNRLEEATEKETIKKSMNLSFNTVMLVKEYAYKENLTFTQVTEKALKEYVTENNEAAFESCEADLKRAAELCQTDIEDLITNWNFHKQCIESALSRNHQVIKDLSIDPNNSLVTWKESYMRKWNSSPIDLVRKEPKLTKAEFYARSEAHLTNGRGGMF